jgi:hypothetical protein
MPLTRVLRLVALLYKRTGSALIKVQPYAATDLSAAIA